MKCLQSRVATLHNNLMVISNWAFQWKMICNPDLTKQVQEVIFSRKTKKLLHPHFSFNNIPLKNSIFQKLFGLTLDVTLNFTQKIAKLWAYCVDFNPSYQDHPQGFPQVLRTLGWGLSQHMGRAWGRT